MAHHGSTPFAFEDDRDGYLKDMARRLMPPQERLGATGKYPEGKYTEQDEGEIAFGIASDTTNEKLLINFGKPVAWVGMMPEQAEAVADSLRDHAREVREAQKWKEQQRA